MQDIYLLLQIHFILDYFLLSRMLLRNAFSIFCEGLLGKVSKLALWAAAIDFQLRPSCLAERKLTVPLRSPPVVVREVSRSNQIQTKQVYEYTGNGIPSPTDGPEVKRLRHAGQAGHSEVRPRDCVECGHNIADILERLNLYENGTNLIFKKKTLSYWGSMAILSIIS